MKVWGNKELAQGYVEDEHYRYHVLIKVSRNTVIALITRNEK